MAEHPSTRQDAVLFSYSLTHLLKKDKIRFYYALKGRDGQSGVVTQYDIDHLGKTVLLVPKKHASNVEAFLTFWKCAFKRREVILK